MVKRGKKPLQAAEAGAVRAEAGAAAGGEGSEVTNRDPSNLTCVEFEPVAGIDTVYIGLYGNAKHPDALAVFLDAGRAKAKEAKDEIWMQNDEEGGIVHHAYAGQAMGMRCKWRLTYQGITFMIRSDMNTQMAKIPTMQVQIHSMELLRDGYVRCLEHVMQVCEMLGFDVTGNRVSRLDVCVDLPVDVGHFFMGWWQRKFVTRATKWNVTGRNEDENPAETIYFGDKSSPIKLRIYDKLMELKNNEIKQQLVRTRIWKGVTPTYSTRVEFQIAGAAIVERFGVMSLTDIEAQMGNICAYLTEDWFRLVTETNTKVNQDRIETDEIWERVQSVFRAWAGISIRKPEKRIKPAPEMRRLQQMFYGVISSIYASHGFVPEEPEDLLRCVIEGLDDPTVYSQFKTICAVKRRKVIEKHGADVYYKGKIEFKVQDL